MLFHYLIFVICIASTQCYVQAAAAAGAGAGKKVETQKIGAQEQELALPLPLAQVIPEPKPGVVVAKPKIDDPIMAGIVYVVHAAQVVSDVPEDLKMLNHEAVVKSLNHIALSEKQIGYIVAHRNEFIKAVGALPKEKAKNLDQRIRNYIYCKALKDAVMNNSSEEKLKQLVDKGCDPFYYDPSTTDKSYKGEKLHFDIMSPFMVAFWNQNATALKLFFRLNPRNAFGLLDNNIVEIIASHSSLKPDLLNRLRWLFNEVIDPDIKTNLPYIEDQPLLVHYAKHYREDIVDILLHAGANPNQKYEQTEYKGDQETIRITSFIQELPNYSPAVQKVWADYQAFLAQQRQEIQRELNKNNRLPVHDIQKLIGEYL